MVSALIVSTNAKHTSYGEEIAASRSADIENLMIDVRVNLMPLCIPDHALYCVYENLQEWKLSVEWQYPRMGADTSARIAESILRQLVKIHDRKLADEIKNVVQRYTAHLQSDQKESARFF